MAGAEFTLLRQEMRLVRLYRQFLAFRERPAEFALSPGFYRTLVTSWRAMAPLVAFLNEPLVAGLKAGTLGSAWTDAEL